MPQHCFCVLVCLKIECLFRYDKTVKVYHFWNKQDSGSHCPDLSPSASPRDLVSGNQNCLIYFLKLL